MSSQPVALYVHIPFCETKCSYCSFNTFARLEHLIPSYVKALAAEIEAWGEALGGPQVQTVFLGGGTPSWLPLEALAEMLGVARRVFSFAVDCETTVEANPGDLTSEKAGAWRALRVSRLSIGVQSLDDAMLRLLTRRHTAVQAVEAVRTALDAGFASVNLDLMYGLPGQTLAGWRSTLERAVDLGTQHVSLYALTVEEGTPLHRDVTSGRVAKPDPDLAADMYCLAEDVLAARGFRHYEISNWALPGCECRHNLVYWRNGPFLGVGPGAHSHLDGARFWTIKSPAEYVRRMSAPRPASGWTPAAIPVIEDRRLLAEAEVASETVILRLRLDEGLAPEEIRAIGGRQARRFIQALDRCAALGLVSCASSGYRLTQRGRLLSNEVFVRLLPD